MGSVTRANGQEPSLPVKDDLDLKDYRFRGLHPSLFMGTASDRYSGWIGQIYSEDLYQGRIISRGHKVGGKFFQEQVLPVESVGEYFRHFRVLEIDYTFYRTLRDANGRKTETFRLLKDYRRHMGEDDHLLLKAPQITFAQKLRRGAGYVANEQYLNANIFMEQFYHPANDLLGENLRGFIFEQEYQRSADRQPTTDVIHAFGEFFTALPKDDRYHVELRTESYLSPEMFALLENFGIGQVLSHWTWLPPLARQFALAGKRFFNTGRQAVIRLMTPIGTRYEDAYAAAYPFDKLVQEMVRPAMLNDTAQLMRQGIEQGVDVNVIINNRAGGNAPALAQLIAQKFLGLASHNEAQPKA